MECIGPCHEGTKGHVPMYGQRWDQAKMGPGKDGTRQRWDQVKMGPGEDNTRSVRVLLSTSLQSVNPILVLRISTLAS